MTGAKTTNICFIILLSIVAVRFSVVMAAAQDAGGSEDREAQYKEELAQRDRLIEQLQSRYDDLEKRLKRIEEQSQTNQQSPGVSTVIERPQAGMEQAEPFRDGQNEINSETPATNTAITDTAHLESDIDDQQDRLIRSAFENTLVERGGLLLPFGRYDIDTTVTYIHSSSENIVVDGFTIFPVLVVGDIVSERLTRDVNVLNVALRFGLPWDSQAEIRIPYGHQKLRSSSADGVETELNDNGPGDIELSFAHQLYKGDERWPDIVAAVRWKSITGSSPFSAAEGDIFVGSGYHSSNLSVSAVKVNDPVVYFAGLGYTLNNTTDESIGRFEPGDSWGFNVGMAIALNLSNSLSFAYDQQFTRASKLDGDTVPGTYLSTGVFSIGSSFLITDTLSVDVSVGVGVTEDSPDLLLSASMPIRRGF